MILRRVRLVAIAAAILLFAASQSTRAAPLVVFGISGNLAASATFDTSGSDLIIRLTNTSLFDVLVPSDVLTTLFYDSTVPLTLTRVSVDVPATSTVFFFGPPFNGPFGVGGEWSYRESLPFAPQGQAYGVSADGMGLFGPPHVFPGGNLSGPGGPDGLDWGLLSAGDDPAMGNTPVTGGDGPLIRNEVVITLSGLPAGFNPLLQISNVFFQYGTSMVEPGYPGVPEPTTSALLLAGAALVLVRARPKRRF